MHAASGVRLHSSLSEANRERTASCHALACSSSCSLLLLPCTGRGAAISSALWAEFAELTAEDVHAGVRAGECHLVCAVMICVVRNALNLRVCRCFACSTCLCALRTFARRKHPSSHSSSSSSSLHTALRDLMVSAELPQAVQTLSSLALVRVCVLPPPAPALHRLGRFSEPSPLSSLRSGCPPCYSILLSRLGRRLFQPPPTA
jgi:hypothetical protein